MALLNPLVWGSTLGGAEVDPPTLKKQHAGIYRPKRKKKHFNELASWESWNFLNKHPLYTVY